MHANQPRPGEQPDVSDLQGGQEEEAHDPGFCLLLIRHRPAAGRGGAAAGGGTGAAQGAGVGTPEAGGGRIWQHRGAQRNCLFPEP